MAAAKAFDDAAASAAPRERADLQNKLGEPNRFVAAGGRQKEGKEGRKDGCMTDARDFVGKCISQLEAAFPPSLLPSLGFEQMEASSSTSRFAEENNEWIDLARSPISMRK